MHGKTIANCHNRTLLSVTRLVCRFRWSSGWWSGICIINHQQLIMLYEHIHMCLHWCSAHLSAALEPGHICCGSSAPESQGLYHQMKQWLMIRDAHQFNINWRCYVTRLSQSAATIRSKCHHIRYSVVLTFIFCTSERCTWTGHVRWFIVLCSPKIFLSSHEAAVDELGSAAYCIIN